MVEPELCRTIDEVRAGIDEIDDAIITLLAKRFRFIEAAARVKEQRETVRDNRRKAEIITRLSRSARSLGLPEELIARLYDQLIEGAIAFEFAKFDVKD